MKKIVVKVTLDSAKCRKRVLKTLANVEGVVSVSVDKDSQFIVIGDADPVRLVRALRKVEFVEIISVGPAKEKKEASLDDLPAKEKKGASLDDLKDFSVHKRKGATLDDLKDFISYASKTFKEKNWPATPLTFNSDFWDLTPEGSEHFKRSIEYAIEGTDEEEDTYLESFITTILVSLKSTQLITVATLVVASVLQKWESIYKFNEQYFELLGNMIHIANLLLGIESRKIEMGDSLILKLSRRSINCIMDGFWLCRFAIRAFTREEEDVSAVTKNMFKLQMQLTSGKTINKNSLKLEQVIDLLELEADTNALAVVLQGYGGLGKTTLADAVFSNVFVEREEFLCSKVEISQNSNSISHIIELQENILKGLLGDEEVSVSSDSEGRSRIGCLLKEAAVFIYIDNIMSGIDLTKLLPGNLGSAKRLRLLFTTRDSDLCRTLKLSRPVKVYEMERLSEKGATWYVKRNLSENIKDMLRSSEIHDLYEVSLGIPSILDSIIKRLNDHEGDIHLDYARVTDENIIGIYRETLMEIFGLEHLGKEAKEALLDICAYFDYPRWENAKLIFRPDVLASLISRSLAMKEENDCIRMHPVLENLNRVELETTRITCKSDPLQLSEDEEVDVKGISVTSNIHMPEFLLDNVSGSLRVLRLGSPMKNECEECFESLIYLECTAPILLTAPNLRYLHIRSDASVSPTLGNHFLVEFNTFRKLKIMRLEDFLQLRLLPDSIHVLSELRVLELRGFSMLQGLGNGLSYLSALQALSLCDCPELSGKWLDYVLKLSSLRYLDIKNSTKLEEMWRTIDPLCYEELLHLVVQTSEADDELLKRISSQFPGPQEFEVDRDREAFDITKLVPGSAVFFVVDCGTAPSLVWLLQQIVETCDENVQIVYIGHHRRELSPQVLHRISGFSHVKSTAHRLLQLYYNTSKIRQWSPPKEKNFVFLMDCTIKTYSKNSRYISCNQIADEKKTMLEIMFSSSKKKLIFQDGHTFLVKELFNFKEELCYGFETKEISMCTSSGKQIILLVMLTFGNGLIDTALEESTSFQKYKTLSSTSDTHDYYFLYLPHPVIDEEIMGMKEWIKKNCPSIVPIEKPWSLRPEFTFFVRSICRQSSLAVIDIKEDGEIVSLKTFARSSKIGHPSQITGGHVHKTSSSSSSIGMAEHVREGLLCITEEVEESSLRPAGTGMAKEGGKKLFRIKDKFIDEFFDSGTSKMILAKSQLLEYTQKASLPAPVYQSIKEGPSHEPIFKASVIVNGITYECPSAFRNRKPAEHAAALLALESLLKDAKESKDIDSVYASGLCKNLLQEYSQKLNLPVPFYKCVKTGEGNEAKFVCTVEIAGQSYVGGPARSKKDAAVKAARTALYVMGQQHNVPLGSSAVPVDPKSESVDATNNKRPHNDAEGGKKFKKRKANLKPRNWKKCKDNNNDKEIGAKEPEAEQTTNADDANKEILSQDEKQKQEGRDMLKSITNGENSSPHKNDGDKETK